MENWKMGFTIMLVEDYPVFLEMTEFALRTAGYSSIETYNNACSALERIHKAGPPDLIITDYDMPYMNGLEFAGMVSERYSHVKIIIITGNPEFVRSRYCRYTVIGKIDGDFCSELIQTVDRFNLKSN